MNILHIGKFYPPDVGGMETFLQALADAQAGQGHCVTVLVHRGQSQAFAESERGQNPCVERHAIQAHIGAYAPIALGIPISMIKKCFGKERPHIIHVHTPNVAAFWAALFAPQAIVVHWHSDVLLPPASWSRNLLLKAWRLVEKYILYRAARVIATSQAYLDISPFLQSVRHKCRVVPLALADEQNAAAMPTKEHAALAFLHSAQGDMPILAVGRLAHYKGFSVLLRAVHKVPRVRLCLIGSGELHSVLEQEIKNLGLEERVLLAGNVDDDILRACYNACEVFVLPSVERTEAFGMVLLEAMRAGKACISTSVPGSGMSCVVKERVTGLVVPPNNSDALAQALHFLQDNEAQRQCMGQQGRLRWEQEYSLNAALKATDAVYAEIISARGCF